MGEAYVCSTLKYGTDTLVPSCAAFEAELQAQAFVSGEGGWPVLEQLKGAQGCRRRSRPMALLTVPT